MTECPYLQVLKGQIFAMQFYDIGRTTAILLYTVDGGAGEEGSGRTELEVRDSGSRRIDMAHHMGWPGKARSDLLVRTRQL